jgi:hypothetical protein
MEDTFISITESESRLCRYALILQAQFGRGFKLLTGYFLVSVPAAISQPLASKI